MAALKVCTRENNINRLIKHSDQDEKKNALMVWLHNNLLKVPSYPYLASDTLY